MNLGGLTLPSNMLKNCFILINNEKKKLNWIMFLDWENSFSDANLLTSFNLGIHLFQKFRHLDWNALI